MDVMPDAHKQVRKALKSLQQIVRQKKDEGAVIAQQKRINGDAAGDEQVVGLTSPQVAAISDAKAVLKADPSFEYMMTSEDDLWIFAGQCLANRSVDHSGEFVRQHARNPIEAACCFAVEFLTVTAESQIGDVRILPLDHPDIAEVSAILAGGATGVGSVAVVTVRGTRAEAMAARGRPVVGESSRCCAWRCGKALAITPNSCGSA
jgi:hypothetical protein